MEINRTIELSCPYFSGYKCNVNINEFESSHEIVNVVLNQLQQTLETHNFENLLIKLENRKKGYHIHDYEIGYMLIEDKTYYICNHEDEGHSSINPPKDTWV